MCSNAASDVNNALHTGKEGMATFTVEYGPYMN